jgi:geranylgeranylglycerol-phosphate geranylgeranyltransferase
MPLIFISACTFLLNDLDDIEKDKINHPDRPLPRGEVQPRTVVVFYYFSLAAALLTIQYLVITAASALYYVLLTLAISYSYIVEYMPEVKAPYVATTSALPLLIVLVHYPKDDVLWRIVPALFLFMLGRELCKDIMDRPGDPPSSIHRWRETTIARFAFACEFGGLLLAVCQPMHGAVDATVRVVAACLATVAIVCWFRWERREASVQLLKALMFVGLYFLLP